MPLQPACTSLMRSRETISEWSYVLSISNILMLVLIDMVIVLMTQVVLGNGPDISGYKLAKGALTLSKARNILPQSIKSPTTRKKLGPHRFFEDIALWHSGPLSRYFTEVNSISYRKRSELMNSANLYLKMVNATRQRLRRMRRPI
jgi:hypothetical protein